MAKIVEFEPIETSDVPSLVVNQIISALQNGKLEKGDRLPSERDMAKMFGIGRPSLREALNTLAVLGVLEIKRGDGTYVKSTSTGARVATKAIELLQADYNPFITLEARLLLEPNIANMASQRAESQDLAAIQSLLPKMEERSKENKPLGDLDLDFHVYIARATKNPLIEQVARFLLNSWIGKGRRWDELQYDVIKQEGRLAKYVHQHRKIYEAIKEKDSEQSECEARNHIETLLEDFVYNGND